MGRHGASCHQCMAGIQQYLHRVGAVMLPRGCLQPFVDLPQFHILNEQQNAAGGYQIHDMEHLPCT
jgi:hypothetical protein